MSTFGAKIQNLLLIVKLRTKTNWNMQTGNKYVLWGKLAHKIKIFSFDWSLVSRIQLRRFWLEIPFLGKSDRKTYNCLFTVKFFTKNNSNIYNLMLLFTFSVFEGEYISFMGKLRPKNTKLFVESEIWRLDHFEYAEFIVEIHFFCFRSKMSLLGKS